MTLTRNFLLSILLCVFVSGASATKVQCPQGLTWVFDGYCKKLLVDSSEICPSKSRKAKLSVTAPLICLGEGICPKETAPDSLGECVPVPVVKCPARFAIGEIARCKDLGTRCTIELQQNIFVQCGI